MLAVGWRQCRQRKPLWILATAVFVSGLAKEAIDRLDIQRLVDIGLPDDLNDIVVIAVLVATKSVFAAGALAIARRRARGGSVVTAMVLLCLLLAFLFKKMRFFKRAKQSSFAAAVAGAAASKKELAGELRHKIRNSCFVALAVLYAPTLNFAFRCVLCAETLTQDTLNATTLESARATNDDSASTLPKNGSTTARTDKTSVSTN